jgi:probable phosphoglycerate mutase
MAVFLLIRHGHNDSIGRTLVGRSAGVRLNGLGNAQAEALAERLAAVRLDAVYSSPLERARETAAPIARRQGLAVGICEGIQEIDFGAWAGKSFADLEPDPRWRQFNTFRSGTRVPGGELMVEVQTRMVGEMERLRQELPAGRFALVSHGDPIKSALFHYAGVPLDLILRFEISLASVSIVDIRDTGPRILCINHSGSDLPPF